MTLRPTARQVIVVYLATSLVFYSCRSSNDDERTRDTSKPIASQAAGPPRSSSAAALCPDPDLDRLLKKTGGTLTIEDIKKIDMDGDGTPELAVVTKITDPQFEGGYWINFDLFVCDSERHSWRSGHHIERWSGEGCERSVTAVVARASNEKQLLIQQTCGSGAFLAFAVLGLGSGGAVRTLLSEGDLGRGEIEVQGRALVVGSHDQAWKYEWRGNDFEKSSYHFLPPPNSVVVHYWFDKDGAGSSDLSAIALEVGQAVFLLRDVERYSADAAPRIQLSIPDLSNPDSCLKWINAVGANGFRGVGQCDASVFVRPETGPGELHIPITVGGGRKSVADRQITSTLKNSDDQEQSSRSSLDVISDPVGAEVLVNGVIKGRTPVRLSDLDPGRYAFEVRKEGYTSYKKTTEVEANNDYEMRVVLPTALTSLQVKSEPPGAAAIHKILKDHGMTEKDIKELRIVSDSELGLRVNAGDWLGWFEGVDLQGKMRDVIVPIYYLAKQLPALKHISVDIDSPATTKHDEYGNELPAGDALVAHLEVKCDDLRRFAEDKVDVVTSVYIANRYVTIVNLNLRETWESVAKKQADLYFR